MGKAAVDPRQRKPAGVTAAWYLSIGQRVDTRPYLRQTRPKRGGRTWLEFPRVALGIIKVPSAVSRMCNSR